MENVTRDKGNPYSASGGPARRAERSPPSRRSWYRDPLLGLLLIGTLILDQITKWLVVSNMSRGESIPAEGLFRITYVQNPGSAFGLFQDHGTALTFISLAAVAVMIYFYHSLRLPPPMIRAALGLQMGGALGNVIDRLRHGSVVDFIDVGWWPIFNIADSAIVVGITVLALYFITRRDADPAAGHSDAIQDPGPAGDPGGGKPGNLEAPDDDFDGRQRS